MEKVIFILLILCSIGCSKMVEIPEPNFTTPLDSTNWCVPLQRGPNLLEFRNGIFYEYVSEKDLVLVCRYQALRKPLFTIKNVYLNEVAVQGLYYQNWLDSSKYDTNYIMFVKIINDSLYINNVFREHKF